MDESKSDDYRPGGTVEPVTRGSSKVVTPASRDRPAARYELRDPFAEVTYRSSSFDEIATKADALGANRFTAISPEGLRSPVMKAEGRWTRTAEGLEADRRGDRVAPPGTLARPNASDSVAEGVAVASTEVEADRRARLQRIDASLSERYLIKRAALQVGAARVGQTEYRHRGDPSRIAFTESTFRLSTETDSPSVARSMVDVAEYRNWRGLHVKGSADFRRLVWIEASARGVRAVGYEPVPGDLEAVQKLRDSRQMNRIDRTNDDSRADVPGDATKKASTRGGSRKAVLAAIDAVLIAKRIPERQREAVMLAAGEQLARRTRDGEVHRVKVYDRTAPPAQRFAQPQQELRRGQERAVPAR